MNEIAIGAFSGVVASAILFVIKVLTDKYFIPLFQKISYQGAIVAGRWIKSTTENDDQNPGCSVSHHIALTLEQNGHDLKGYLDVRTDRVSGTVIRNYVVNGRYIDGYLQLLCSAKGPGISSYCSILLKNKGSGKVLHGIMAYRSAVTDDVGGLEMALDREKD